MRTPSVLQAFFPLFGLGLNEVYKKGKTVPEQRKPKRANEGACYRGLIAQVAGGIMVGTVKARPEFGRSGEGKVVCSSGAVDSVANPGPSRGKFLFPAVRGLKEPDVSDPDPKVGGRWCGPPDPLGAEGGGGEINT